MESKKIPVAMSIAGSDSGGGAGIQADLKTFAALGVHGTTAITAITAQNTYEVTAIQVVDHATVEAQIRAVHEDMGIDAAKTGMLYDSEVIKTVSRVIDEYGIPLIVDPVIVAKSGALLLKSEAVDSLIGHLLPKALIVTPNRMEAEVLSKIKISTVEDAKKAAKEISSLGPKAVVVKGGHLEGDSSIDVLYYDGSYYLLEAPRLDAKTTHGTGCSFSAAITAYIAKGYGIVESVKNAKQFVTRAIKYGLRVGKGYGPVNPMSALYNEASKVQAMKEFKAFLNKLKEAKGIEALIPEVGMNVAYASLEPIDKNDILAIPGRIRRDPFNGILYFPPEFGASDHLARYLLKIREYDPSIRVAINVKFDRKILEILERMGMKISFYDRSEEPPEVKRVEGSTIQWGVETAIRKIGSVPRVIYHTGDVGKEPMIVIFSRTLEELMHTLNEILKDYCPR